MCLAPSVNDDVPVVHVDVRALALAKLLGVPSDAPVDEGLWLGGVRDGDRLSEKEMRRARSHVRRAWRQLHRWFDLDGKWRTTVDFQYRVTDEDRARLEAVEIVEDIRSATADLRNLPSDALSDLDLQGMPELLTVASRQVGQMPRETVRVPMKWMKALVDAVVRMPQACDEEKPVSGLSVAVGRIRKSTILLCPGAAITWAIDGKTISSPIPLDACWTDCTLHVNAASEDDIPERLKAIVRETMAQVGRDSLIGEEDVYYCFGRPQADIERYFKKRVGEGAPPSEEGAAAQRIGQQGDGALDVAVGPGRPEPGDPEAEPDADKEPPPSRRPVKTASPGTERPPNPPGHGSSAPWRPEEGFGEKSPTQSRLRTYVARTLGAGIDEDDKATELGDKAEEIVLEAERKNGRNPRRMPPMNAGYDIESSNDDGTRRFIEVKGVRGVWGDRGVGVTSTQFRTALERGDAWWLYVVEHVDDGMAPAIHRIPNPFLVADEYRFDDGWRGVTGPEGVADAVSAGMPIVGACYRRNGELVTVECIHRAGALTEVDVKRSDGSTARVMWIPSWERVGHGEDGAHTQ
jgi:hypothetical protein